MLELVIYRDKVPTSHDIFTDVVSNGLTVTNRGAPSGSVTKTGTLLFSSLPENGTYRRVPTEIQKHNSMIFP